MLVSNPNKSNDMKELIKKEKELHNKIKSDFKKISKKINCDVDKAIQSKSACQKTMQIS